MPHASREFNQQTAVITGGASGIGRAAAHELARRGADLVLADINADAADQVAQQIRDTHHVAATPMRLDVADSQSVDQVFTAAHAEHERIDILVHSAGVGVEAAFLDTDDTTWRRLIDIDLSGTFFTNRAAGRLMKAAGYGRIINIASTAGLVGGTGRAAYGAAKGGVIMLTRVLAVELGRDGVTVNALAPGAIETELVARMHSPETRHVYRAGIPMDRYGTPEEVADAIAFLARPEARYITGEVLAVDGGFLAAGVMHRKTAVDGTSE